MKAAGEEVKRAAAQQPKARQPFLITVVTNSPEMLTQALKDLDAAFAQFGICEAFAEYPVRRHDSDRDGRRPGRPDRSEGERGSARHDRVSGSGSRRDDPHRRDVAVNREPGLDSGAKASGH